LRRPDWPSSDTGCGGEPQPRLPDWSSLCRVQAPGQIFPLTAGWLAENPARPIRAGIASWGRRRTGLENSSDPKQLERLNQEIKRRTHVIRIFPNEESALRLIRALAVEIHEDWIEAHRYLNMEMLREQRKQLQLLEAA
jgi:putative transposase